MLRGVLTVLAATVVLAGAAPAAAQGTHEVEVRDNFYEPETVDVAAGDTVRWSQVGSQPHSITADDGSFDSHPDCDFSSTEECMSEGETYSETFDESGEYPYYCRIHGGPGGQGMSGVVVVEEAGEESEPPFDGDAATTGRVDADTPTAAAISMSRERFDDGAAAHAVLSRDDEFADSLAGSALTGDGPLLFTNSTTLTPTTRQELGRVVADGGTIFLLGGTQAISAEVADGLREEGYDVQRLSGPTRVETALAVADRVVARSGGAEQVLLARATAPEGNPTAGWADSVSGGSVAARSELAVLVTPSDTLHGAVQSWLDEHQPGTTWLLGGTAALSEAIEQTVPNAERVAGPERTATAVAIAETLWGPDEQRFTVIDAFREDGWAFGLAAAGLAAEAGAPLLAVHPDQVPGPTADLISRRGGADAVELALVGSAAVISEERRADLDAIE